MLTEKYPALRGQRRRIEVLCQALSARTQTAKMTRGEARALIKGLEMGANSSPALKGGASFAPFGERKWSR